MSVFEPFLESMCYGDLDSVRKMVIDEGGGGVTLTNTGTQRLTDALAAFAVAANASGSLSNTYTFSINSVDGTVTLAASGVTEFGLNHSLASYLGFSVSTLTSLASYTSDVTPLGFYVPLAVDYDIPAPAEDGKLLEFRAGRARANVWHHTHTLKIRIKGLTADIEAHLGGPIFRGGLIRFAPTDQSQEFSYAFPDGWIDASIMGIKNLRTIGQEEELAEVELECQMELDN